MDSGAGGSAQASTSASQATPLVDGGYLYSQLYTMATSFSAGGGRNHHPAPAQPRSSAV